MNESNDYKCSSCGAVLRIVPAARRDGYWPHCRKCDSSAWMPYTLQPGEPLPPRVVPPHTPGFGIPGR